MPNALIILAGPVSALAHDVGARSRRRLAVHFGGPLAMEGLAAFFLESTFLGLWVFGWDRLSPRVHLFCIWMVALGATCSCSMARTRRSAA